MPSVLSRCLDHCLPVFSTGTLVSMSSGMFRRFASLLALSAATIAATTGAGPAQAGTLYTLTGHGWGHGIGLSQYGSLGYAQHGWSYSTILAHYFEGTTLAPLRNPVQERVLLASGRSSIALGAST